MTTFELDPSEIGPLAELRAVTGDLGQNDLVLIRFLRARNMNTNKAENMLRNCLKWREENDVKTLKDWDAPEIIKKDYLYSFSGYDDENRPIVIVPYGRWEVRKMIEKGLKEQSLRYVTRFLELIMAQLEKTGSQQFHIVLDSGEMTFWKVAHLETIETVVQLFRNFESYYPETLKSCVVINTPWVFPYIYGFVKPMLSTRTLSKVQFFDSNETKWKEALCKAYPVDALPNNYGGTAASFQYKSD